jgi:hypothetical protein
MASNFNQKWNKIKIWDILMNLKECGIFIYRIAQVVLRQKPLMCIK